MSSSMYTVQLNDAEMLPTPFELEQGGLEEVAFSGSGASDLRRRHVVAQDPGASSLSHTLYEVKASTTENARASSIHEHSDGTPRVIQKSYWSQGVCAGIYYLFQYWIVLNEVSVMVMDVIYRAVRESVASKNELDIDALRVSLQFFMEDPEIQYVLENHFDMIRHALGYTHQPEELILALHTHRKVEMNVGFLDCLVKITVGESLLEQAAVDLMPQGVGKNGGTHRSCYQYLQDFVAQAKCHPIYEKMEQAIGKDPVCAEIVAELALDMVKQKQTRSVTCGWFGLFEPCIDPKVNMALKELHKSFARSLALYSVRDVRNKAILTDLQVSFELDFNGFLPCITYVKENRSDIHRLVDSYEADAFKVLGNNDLKKMKALLKLIDGNDDQHLLVVQQILEQFSKQGASFSSGDVAAFFAKLESDIQAKQGVLIGASSSELLGEACFQGFDLIASYLGEHTLLLTKELVYWSLLAKLQPKASTIWNVNEIANTIAPLIARFQLEPVASVIAEHRGDFNRTCGLENTKTLLEYFEGVRQAGILPYLST